MQSGRYETMIHKPLGREKQNKRTRVIRLNADCRSTDSRHRKVVIRV